jgi:hypothetical protein
LTEPVLQDVVSDLVPLMAYMFNIGRSKIQLLCFSCSGCRIPHNSRDEMMQIVSIKGIATLIGQVIISVIGFLATVILGMRTRQ